MCKRTIVITMPNVGKVGKMKCQRPDYKDGLCAYHYTRKIKKETPWGERKNYNPATIDDITRYLKLKDSTENKTYRFRNEIVQVREHKTNSWANTDIVPDINLFCIKSF